MDETIEENVETVITTEKLDKDENANDMVTSDTGNKLNEESSTNDSTTPDDENTPNTNSLNTHINVDSIINDSPSTIIKNTTEELEKIEAPQKQLTFSNIDEAQNIDNTRENIVAPKDVDTLEKISDENHARRMLEEGEGEDDEDSLKISNEDANIQLDIETL